MNIALICGGQSVEHEISLRSARMIYSTLKDTEHRVHLCVIDKQNRWYIITPEILMNTREISSGEEMGIEVNLQKKAFMSLDNDKCYEIDMVFPIVHGTGGEDGVLQALCEYADIPYVGCGVTASALCMNKVKTKEILSFHKIPNARFLSTTKTTTFSYETIKEQLGDTVFVKPSSLGSSVGVHKVANAKEYENAMADAFTYDDEVIIEEAIVGRELECAVLEIDGDVLVSPAGEILIHDHDFYSYDAKYAKGSRTQVVVPAPDIHDDVQENIKKIATKLFRVLGCSGMARIDFFLTAENIIYVNEVNTLPGFTTISMYPKLIEYMGVSNKSLITTLLETSLKRAQIQRSKTHTLIDR